MMRVTQGMVSRLVNKVTKNPEIIHGLIEKKEEEKRRREEVGGCTGVFWIPRNPQISQAFSKTSKDSSQEQEIPNPSTALILLMLISIFLRKKIYK